jgi:hypothetical protein
MATPGFVAVSADGTFATTSLHWEGFTRIAWRALCAVGYITPPFYEGVEYEELGIPSCRVRVTVLPHSGHPRVGRLVHGAPLLPRCRGSVKRPLISGD